MDLLLLEQMLANMQSKNLETFLGTPMALLLLEQALKKLRLKS